MAESPKSAVNLEASCTNKSLSRRPEVRIENFFRRTSSVHYTIPALFGLDSDEINFLWDTFDKETLDEIHLSSADWKCLERKNLTCYDPFSVLLATTVEYLISTKLSSRGLDEIVYRVVSLAQSALQKILVLDMQHFSQLPFKKEEALSKLEEIDLTLFDWDETQKKAIQDLELETLGDILSLSDFGILDRSLSIGQGLSTIGTMNSIMSKLTDECLGLVLSSSPNPYDFSDLIAFIKALEEDKGIQWKHLYVYLLRKGFFCGTQLTLEETGHRVGLSRERIRQIERKVTKQLLRQRETNERTIVEILITGILNENKGIARLSTVATHLGRVFRCKETPSKELTLFLSLVIPSSCLRELSLNPSFEIHDRAHVLSNGPNGLDSFLVTKDLPCISCEHDASELIDSVKSSSDPVPINQVLTMIENNFCKKCQIRDEQKSDLSSMILMNRIFGHEETVVDNGKLYCGLSKKINFGTLLEAVEAILKNSKKAMHFKKVFAELTNRREDYKETSERNIHATLSRSKNLLLWDRGTFIHKDHVVLPFKLLKQIEDYIIAKLSSVKMTSVSGIFYEFRQKLEEASVPTETALYTCLRMTCGNDVVFPKYPRISLRNNSRRGISMIDYAESLLREFDGEMSQEKFNSLMLNDLGLKEFQIQQMINNMRNVVRTERNGFVHCDNLNIDTDFVENIATQVSESLNNLKHISIIKIFRANQVSCITKGIEGPKMLYSLLRLNEENHEFVTTRYPQLVKKTVNEENELMGVRSAVVEFLRDVGTVCSGKEIEERFILGLGYPEQTVRTALSSSKSLFRYASNSYVHLEMIEKEIEKVEKAAEVLFLRLIKAGDLFATIDQLLDENRFKPIDDFFPWTADLIVDVFRKGGKFMTFGSGQQAYLPSENPFKIDSLSKLINIIVLQKFDGIIGVDILGNYLRDKKVILKNLPINLFNSPDGPILDENIVVARGEFNARDTEP